MLYSHVSLLIYFAIRYNKLTAVANCPTSCGTIDRVTDLPI